MTLLKKGQLGQNQNFAQKSDQKANLTDVTQTNFTSKPIPRICCIKIDLKEQSQGYKLIPTQTMQYILKVLSDHIEYRRRLFFASTNFCELTKIKNFANKLLRILPNNNKLVLGSILFIHQQAGQQVC
eukprot:TRINITY_DN6748_c0_g1_i8.p16 TRINITY_DN6748_c0_g1~~TRINITY_DN6748_c0_g1_i8.p16  ORF type:complete len:128 (+),score=0.01 TRINITY_DN6748_c0_g1_i8:2813-3196(+)